MSFLNHLGLGFLDPTNELDKLGNAIKDGDPIKIVQQFTDMFEDIENRLEGIADLFEDETVQAKKDVRREAVRIARAEVRKARRDLIDLQEKFGEKLMGQMQTKISQMVEAEVSLRMDNGSGSVDNTLPNPHAEA